MQIKRRGVDIADCRRQPGAARLAAREGVTRAEVREAPTDHNRSRLHNGRTNN
jgi:hypothetical protein